MEVYGRYQIRLQMTVDGSPVEDATGDFESSQDLVEAIGGRSWSWLGVLIDDLIQAPSIGVRHPDGKSSWYFVVQVNYWSRRKLELVNSVGLLISPAIHGKRRIPAIKLKKNSPITIAFITAHIKKHKADFRRGICAQR